MSFSVAVLDMAGTTVEEGGRVYDVLAATVAEFGRPATPEALARWKGTSKREAIAGLLDESVGSSRVDEAFAWFVERLVGTYRADPPTPLPGVPEALAELRARGIRVALQTGYSAPVARSILDGLGWTIGPAASDTVDALVTSDLVPLSRPAPYLVFRCMEATGITNVAEVLVAGDTPNDLGAGTNAGAGYVVGVLTGSFDRAGLAAHTHTHILRSVADLPTLL